MPQCKPVSLEATILEEHTPISHPLKQVGAYIAGTEKELRANWGYFSDSVLPTTHFISIMVMPLMIARSSEFPAVFGALGYVLVAADYVSRWWAAAGDDLQPGLVGSIREVFSRKAVSMSCYLTSDVDKQDTP